MKRLHSVLRVAVGVGMLAASSGALCEYASAGTIHPGDKVDVLVYNHPELSQQVVVSSAGQIAVPLAGEVDVAGLEPSVAARRVRDKLVSFVKLPAVQIRTLTEGTQIVIDGVNGGSVPVTPGESLVAVISNFQQLSAKSGSANSSDYTDVGIKRDGRTIGQYDVGALQRQGQSGPIVLPGDAISIRNKPVAVNVAGAVKAPGVQYVSRDATIASVVGEAGGVTENAAPALTKVTQNGKDSTVALGSTASSQAVTPGETIYVPSAANIQVIGNVDRQGIVELRDDNSLLSALYLAGGPSYYGDIRKVTVMRGGKTLVYNITALQKGDLSQNPMLQDGDIVYVPENKKFNFAELFQALTFGRTVSSGGGRRR